MDHAIIRPTQSLVKGGGPAAQFRLSDGALVHYFFKFAVWRMSREATKWHKMADQEMTQFLVFIHSLRRRAISGP
jgi:hypothetical protein